MEDCIKDVLFLSCLVLVLHLSVESPMHDCAFYHTSGPQQSFNMP